MRTLKAMLRALLVLVFLVSPRGPSAEAAEGGVLLTEAMQLKVADAFMDEREYYRAVTEYKRFLILFPDSDRADYALFRTGLACYQGEEYESAAKSFSTLRERYRRKRLCSPGTLFRRAELLEKQAIRRSREHL